MGVIETVVDVVTNNQTLYQCPKCNKEVWAWGSFAGNICWKCPGTLFNAIVGILYMLLPIGLIMTPVIKNQVGVRAKYPSQQVFSMKYEALQNGYNINGSSLSYQDRADRIISYQVFSCRIYHGLYCWAIRRAQKMGFTLDEAEHWWVTVKTQSGKYYSLQQDFDKSSILLHRNSSLRFSHLSGLASAKKCYNSSIWNQPRFSKQMPLTSDKTINDVLLWVKSSDSTAGFDLKVRNSQALCKRFHLAFDS